MKIIIYIMLLVAPITALSQEHDQHNHNHDNMIEGTVYGQDEKGHKQSLPGVNIYWLGSKSGVITDASGHFHINKSKEEHAQLIISYVGYQSDTINVDAHANTIEVVLKSTKFLNEVIVAGHRSNAFISKINPIQVQNITGAEFKKAACCNLSESFETNASVDVHYSDAVTGAKQIQLLGLAGIYSQIMTENIPNVRGMATNYGLEYIPGSWMESIQISKGAATVINGYESTTGQINVEYKKPDHSEKLYLNVLASDKGKKEMNANASVKLNKNWSTMVLLHSEDNNIKYDKNGDSFMDIPLVRQYNFLNRWKLVVPGKYMTQFGIKILDENRSGGQLSFDKTKTRNTLNGYGISIRTKRYEAFAKGGYFFPKKTSASIALITNGSYHDQKSYFGLKDYDGIQKSFNANLIYQTILNNTNHDLNAGLSYMYDDYDETYNDSNFTKQEIVPGIFAQYTLKLPPKLTGMIGIRADKHNLYGTFITPRFHFKYDINKKTIFRTSMGKGYRSPQIYAENSPLLASSRRFISKEPLKHEEAWNLGGSIAKFFDVLGKELTFVTEFYRTEFVNQVIIDMDTDNETIWISNLEGRSYANSMQAEINYELINGLDVLVAYRYLDVKTTINKNLIEKPLVTKYKALLNLSYTTPLKKWQFDLTTQFNGPSRLPSIYDNNGISETSPEYTIIHAQITKYYKTWNIYLGVENLTNFRQEHPIFASDAPFSNDFDASVAWGPVLGRKFYLGLRYVIGD